VKKVSLIKVLQALCKPNRQKWSIVLYMRIVHKRNQFHEIYFIKLRTTISTKNSVFFLNWRSLDAENWDGSIEKVKQEDGAGLETQTLMAMMMMMMQTLSWWNKLNICIVRVTFLNTGEQRTAITKHCSLVDPVFSASSSLNSLDYVWRHSAEVVCFTCTLYFTLDHLTCNFGTWKWMIRFHE
jgi:hypothetical protein